MRRSQSFLKTRKEAPADETSANAQLLIRAGFIHKEMAGVYSFLPPGKRVLDKVIEIIRQEMNAIGGEELLLSTLQPKEAWEKSGRWHDEVVDIWFKTRLHDGRNFHAGPELGLSNTHEEALTAIMSGFVKSYKDLPAYAYHFQTKFRNEPRARSGLLRCREFIMKDLYSFSKSQAEHDKFYGQAKQAYEKVFQRLGLSDATYFTYAAGGTFTTDFSHEFQTLSEAGEDTIYIQKGQKIAVNKEIYNDETLQKLGIDRGELEEKKAIEVGNIFALGTRFSEALGLLFSDEHGSVKPAIMGSYGIGPGRAIGTIVEHYADERGLVWPAKVAPYDVYLARLGDDSEIISAADELYSRLTAAGISVIYDDRDERPGEKFADADLLGIPSRLVLSEKTLTQKAFELKQRTKEATQLVPLERAQELVNRPNG